MKYDYVIGHFPFPGKGGFSLVNMPSSKSSKTDSVKKKKYKLNTTCCAQNLHAFFLNLIDLEARGNKKSKSLTE